MMIAGVYSQLDEMLSSVPVDPQKFFNELYNRLNTVVDTVKDDVERLTTFYSIDLAFTGLPDHLLPDSYHSITRIKE